MSPCRRLGLVLHVDALYSPLGGLSCLSSGSNCGQTGENTVLARSRAGWDSTGDKFSHAFLDDSRAKAVRCHRDLAHRRIGKALSALRNGSTQPLRELRRTGARTKHCQRHNLAVSVTKDDLNVKVC